MGELIHTFEADTCPQAWLDAVEYLNEQKDRSAYNVVLGIATPEAMTAADFAVFDRVDALLRKHDREPLTTVAGTIFPASFYLQEGATGVYETYPELHPKVKSLWGNYAMRMLRKSKMPKPGEKEAQMNPLKVLVEKMKTQLEHARMRGVYEISAVEIDDLLEMPIYDAALDCKRTRCHPCLSHLSFKLLADDRVMLTALYRYHYYIEKALGNLIGLSQLLCFVAKETELRPGPLVCHSTLARIDKDAGWSAHEVEAVIAQCRQAETASELVGGRCQAPS
jgi:hypothetical protein